MYLYNQDWLNRELEVVPQMQEDPYLAHNWLKNMSIGAEKHQVRILYCMPLFRHLLESVEFPQVTQMRSSGDYQPSDRIPNWRVGISNIWSIGLNLTPNKDVFWTSEVEDNSHKYNSDFERNPALQTALAVLSAGVVGPGDGPGFENEELIMSTCRSDGLLLTPEYPLTMPHSQFIYNVFENPKMLAHKTGDSVMTTSTRINGHTFGVIFHALSEEKRTVMLSDVYRINLNCDYVYYTGWEKYSRKFPGTVEFLKKNDEKTDANIVLPKTVPLNPLNKLDARNFQVRYFSPVWEVAGNSHKIAFLGELDKWTTVSQQRVKSFSFDSYSVFVGMVFLVDEVRVEGKPVYFAVDGKVSTANCISDNFHDSNEEIAFVLKLPEGTCVQKTSPVTETPTTPSGENLTTPSNSNTPIITMFQLILLFVYNFNFQHYP